VSIHRGWVTRTSSRLSELGKKYGRAIVVTNASQNGRTTRQALENMAYEVQSPGADILIVQFGMNDCNFWESDRGIPRVSKKVFWANLHEIIDRALAFGVQKIFLNSNHPTGRNDEILPYTDLTYQQSNEQYNAIIRKVASERSDIVTLNEIETIFKNRIKNDQQNINEFLMPKPDLLHLSEKGHDLYFDIVYPKVEAAVITLLKEIHGIYR
jgi:lysophospholipase L1-like esterase